jgi:putative spermidine/putrescine transport system permease protein
VAAVTFRISRAVLLVLFGAFFLIPIFALVEFSTRGIGLDAPRTLESWREIGDYPDLVRAIVVSLELAVVTSIGTLLLLVPTMVWVRLRARPLSRLVEFLCLLPLTIPAIVIVVGLAPVYAWVTYLAPGPLEDSALLLAFVYVVLVLPFAYRAIDTGLSAIDVPTLAEAARSLGAGWPTVMFRVVAPNIRSALLNAALLSVALTLGEFTVASLLNYVNLQVGVNQLAQANAGVSVAVAAALLLFTFVLLLVLAIVGRSGPATRRSRRKGRLT